MKIDYSKLPRHRCLCQDAKSFYASVECALRGLDPLETYLAVAGDLSRKGSVILASTPKLKAEYGIKTGSRLYEIPKDPRILLVDAQMYEYLAVSMAIVRLLNRYMPLEAIRPYSIDENICLLDGTRWSDSWEAARYIQAMIKLECGVPIAVGLGNNFLQSKLILDIRGKKDGIAECCYEDFEQKLWPQPVEDIWGIGPRIKLKLNRLGILTLGQLAQTPLDVLRRTFGPAIGEQLYFHSFGVDLTDPIQPWERLRKGFSHGQTLFFDRTLEDVKFLIRELWDDVTSRMRAAGLAGRTISVAVGYNADSGIRPIQKSRTLASPTLQESKLSTATYELLEDAPSWPIRIVHVGISNLVTPDLIQLDLFDDPEANEREVHLFETVDKLKKKYGNGVIFRANSYLNGTAVSRSRQIGGHQR
ncbi:DNA polymerase thumb domain-containing protein [Cohnella soli]|uniref:DNA polymerase V n=1 Tax=Cohnella soli TaxID=425005 RepID=A0ABW0HP63_9BACL